jgi:hypothetical protein
VRDVQRVVRSYRDVGHDANALPVGAGASVMASSPTRQHDQYLLNQILDVVVARPEAARSAVGGVQVCLNGCTRRYTIMLSNT